LFVLLASAGCLGTADETETPPYGENATAAEISEEYNEDEVQGYRYTLSVRDAETGEPRRESTRTVDHADEEILADENFTWEDVSRTIYVNLSSGIRYVDREMGDAIYPEPQPEEVDADEAVRRYSLSGVVGSLPANETRLSVEETDEEGVFGYSTDSVTVEGTEVTNMSVSTTAEGFVQGFSLTVEGLEYAAEVEERGDIDVKTPGWVNPEEVSRAFDVDRIAEDPSVYVGFSGVGVSGEGGAVYSIDARTGEPQWGFTEPDSGVTTSPTVVDGTVYVGSEGDRVYALNATDGTEVWRYETEGEVTSPTVVDGTVYVGADENTRFPSGGALHALDAKTGERRWVYTPTIRVSSVEAAPAVDDGTVYFGALDGRLHAVDAETGEKRWEFTGPDEDVSSSPTVVDGAVYFGSDDGALYKVDTDTGKEVWNFTASTGWMRSSPTVSDGTVYAGDGSLYAVDAQTGESEWSLSELYGGESSPTVVGDTAYIGELYAVDAEDGEVIWESMEPGGLQHSSPTATGDTVYVGTRQGSVYAVDSETGEKKWEFGEPEGAVRSSPTVVRDPLDGSSVGSRVLYGTLGHHGEVRAGERLTTEDLNIEDTD